MKILILSLLSIIYFTGCTLRPTIEDKSNYMKNIMQELKVNKAFKDKAISKNTKILYNKSILSGDLIEFVMLLSEEVNKSFGYNDLHIGQWEYKNNINGEKKIKFDYSIKNSKNIIECNLQQELVYGIGQMNYLECNLELRKEELPFIKNSKIIKIK